MLDCAADVLAYHDDEVTLPQSERTAMKDRRNANRDRLKSGLKDKGRPEPREFCQQGSYAMLTMVQHANNDYDIDDGVYFDIADLRDSNGTDMLPQNARKMVRDAIDNGSFAKPPEVRKNCVRVYYVQGFHVDIAVYRTTITRDVFGKETTLHELASSAWKRSDARDVTSWFDSENQKQSPDTTNGRQLRRITRMLKKFAKSRESWVSSTASGFTITKLVTECYIKDVTREDRAIYDTLKAVRDRLSLRLDVQHPVTPNELLTGLDDAKTKFLRDKLTDAIGWLSILFDPTCTRTSALAAWDKVLNTEYFSKRASRDAGTGSLLRSAASVSPTFPDRPITPKAPGGFA